MRSKLFVIFSMLMLATMVLSACQPQVIEKTVEVEKPVVQTVIVEQEGEKVVETVVVEVTKEPEAVAKTPLLRINLGTYPDVVDPQKSSYVNEIAHLKMFYEGLTKLNEKLETIPGAAEKWEYSPDATVLTFTLRQGLMYSDGTLLNAKRFQYSILRNVDPATAGEYASITDEIKGATEWRVNTTIAGENACAAADEDGNPACTDEEKAAFAAVMPENVAALDSAGNACVDYEQADCLTLKITLGKPAPYFHTIMGIWVAYPAREELIAEGGDIWWNSSKFQIGNGPFVMTVLEPFVRAYFTPNANYWGEKGKIDIEYRYIVDSAVAFEAYRNNEFDIIASAAEDIDTINNDPDLAAQHLQYPGSCTTLIKFGIGAEYNGKPSPFTDAKVREAFFYAFDAVSWTRDVDANLSIATWTWIPPGYPGYDPEGATPLYDVEKAKAALAASTFGGPEGLNALGLKLTYGDSPRNKVRSEWLVNNYKVNLGVDIALDPVDATTFTALTKDPMTFPLLARQGWCADYPDPQNWLSVYWKSETTFAQRMGYVNADFDALVAEADVTVDPVKRADLYMQAQKLLLADFPSAFGYNSLNHYLVKPWIKGLLTTPQDSDWPGSVVPTSITIDTSMIP